MLQFWINVKNELDFRGLSQKELASCIGESYNTLQSWINRDRLPNVEQGVKIAKVLNTTVEYLVDGSKFEKRETKEEAILVLEKAIKILKINETEK